MATAADWMSAASFISMAGLIAFMGYDGCVYLMGWTGGYVLLAMMLAPYLRKFGKFTVPEIYRGSLLFPERPDYGGDLPHHLLHHLRYRPDERYRRCFLAVSGGGFCNGPFSAAWASSSSTRSWAA